MANQENVTVTGYSTGTQPVDFLSQYAGYAVLALIGVLIVIVAVQGRRK